MDETTLNFHIETVLDEEFATQGFLFTAHDLTKAVRKAVGPSEAVVHEYVRERLVRLFNEGILEGYDRTLVLVNNKKVFVYHPYDHNPMTYPKATGYVAPNGVAKQFSLDEQSDDDGTPLVGDGQETMSEDKKRILECLDNAIELTDLAFTYVDDELLCLSGRISNWANVANDFLVKLRKTVEIF